MLNPMIRWEPGTTVTYHGSLTHLHGNYQAFPCICLRCAGPARDTHRFELRSGDTVITCVRARSITAPIEETL